MKIAAVCCERNEEDIIESYCRYYLNICDLIVIYDDGSTDDTRDVILKMVEEGLNIYLIESEQLGGLTVEVVSRLMSIQNRLARIAFTEYGADLVVPFDSDEFLTREEGGNPREVLEQLDPGKVYRCMQRGYVYQEDPEDNSRFLPAYFRFWRIASLEKYHKVIVSKEIYSGPDATIGNGSHSVDHFIDDQRTALPSEDVPQLRIAHYPLRSTAQTTYKNVTNWLDMLWNPERGSAHYHWKDVYDVVKRQGFLDPETVTYLSYRYLVRNSVVTDELIVTESPIDLSFCGDTLTLKYTHYEKALAMFLPRLLDYFEGAIARRLEVEGHMMTDAVLQQISAPQQSPPALNRAARRQNKRK